MCEIKGYDIYKVYYINSFNRIYNVNYTLKEKEEGRNLKKKIKTRDDRIEELEYKITVLESVLDYFKKLWEKFINFLQDKFFSINKHNDIINELYNEEIINDNDVDIIQNNYKDKNDELER